jgi:hypothetical protein
MAKRQGDRFERLLENLFLEIDQDEIVAEVEALRKRKPKATESELANELASRAAIKAAAVGAGAGAAGGAIGILAMAPDIFNLVRLQSRLILSIAFIYGRKPHLRQRFKEVLATLAISTGASAARQGARYLLQRGLEGTLAKQIMKRIGGRFLTRKLPAIVPVVGGVTGGALNYAAVKATARAAIALYSHPQPAE